MGVYPALGNIIKSIKLSGMKIEFYNEFPYTHDCFFEGMTKKEDGFWYFDNPKYSLPLMFSMKVTL